MTFAANGAFPDQTEFVGAGILNLNNTAVGDLIPLVAISVDSTTNYVTGITGGGADWTQIGVPHVGVNNGGVITRWQGKVTATGLQTANVAVTGGAPTIAICNQEFSSTAGSWTVDATADLDVVNGNSAWPTLTPTGSSELYFGFATNFGIAAAGSTPGYVYHVTNHNDGCAWNVSVSAPSAPVWGDTGQTFGAMILVREPAPPPAASGGMVLPDVELPSLLRKRWLW